jgi:hypothetical protein
MSRRLQVLKSQTPAADKTHDEREGVEPADASNRPEAMASFGVEPAATLEPAANVEPAAGVAPALPPDVGGSAEAEDEATDDALASFAVEDSAPTAAVSPRRPPAALSGALSPPAVVRQALMPPDWPEARRSALPDRLGELPTLPSRHVLLVGGAALALIAVIVFAFAGRGRSTPAPPAPVATEAVGSAQFDSRPSGADVVIDGILRGKTPLRVTLPAGEHALEIRGAGGARTLPLTIEPDVLVSQYVELVPAVKSRQGEVAVASEPAGAQVRLDGALKGTTPLTLDGVEAGDHVVTLTHGEQTIRRRVRVASGETSSVAASFPAQPPPATEGSLAVKSPIELQVFEDGRPIGSTRAGRVALPAGRHTVELVNAELEFRTTRSLEIRPGAATTAEVAIPNGTLSINAIPWAEVIVDGRASGTTPLANLSVPIGEHEVVWRHPEHGERRQQVVVRARTPLRVSVDFTR